MEKEAKVGLALLAASWFWDKKVIANLLKLAEEDAQYIVENLSNYCEVVFPGIIKSTTQARAAAQEFKEQAVELVIICHLMWSEDQPLITLIEENLAVPLLLWAYSPYIKLPEKMDILGFLRTTGPVGAAQCTAALKRFGKNYEFVLGSSHDAKTMEIIREYVKVANLVSKLKKIRIGLLPYRCEAISGTYVDELDLVSQVGPKIKYISIAEYASICESIAEEEIASQVKELKEKFEVDAEVNESTLFQATRASLGLIRTSEVFDLDAIALNDLSDELHKVIGLRPCLYFSSPRKVVIGMEGDLTCVTAMIILSELANSPSMFTETFTFDKTDDSILFGHAGVHNPELANSDDPLRITPDYEYRNSSKFSGAWMEFVARPGPVTLLQLISHRDGIKMLIGQGQALKTKKRIVGYPHIQIRLNVSVDSFFKQIVQIGVSQHWAIVSGDLQEQLEVLGRFLKIDVIVIR